MFTVLTDAKVVSQPVIGNLDEYESSTIRRVVRSTTAAFSVALPKSLNRQLYQRLMVGSLLYGQLEVRDTDWRVDLRVPGILVTHITRACMTICARMRLSHQSDRRSWMCWWQRIW